MTENKDQFIILRVTKALKDTLTAKAEKAGVSLSSFVRSKIKPDGEHRQGGEE